MLAAASAALASLPGCAFVFSQGPPPRERQAQETYFDCSGSWMPAIVDTVFAAATGINTVGAYSDRNIEHPHGTAAIAAGFTVLFAASAIYGVTAVASCGRAKTARLERKQREELLPAPYGMPPWGQPPPYWPPPPLPAAYRAPAPAVAPKAAPEPAVAPKAPPEPALPPALPEAPPPPAAPVFKPAPPAQ